MREFKQLAAHAQAGRWSEAERELADLAPQLGEIRDVLGVDLGPGLSAALRARDRAELARQLTHLAYSAIELKLVSTLREDPIRYYPAKYRVEAARTTYMELLAPPVRRYDADHDSALHARIWDGFDAARAALGRPGFLGRGVVPPDRARFESAALGITADLREVFPFISEARQR